MQKAKVKVVTEAEVIKGKKDGKKVQSSRKN